LRKVQVTFDCIKTAYHIVPRWSEIKVKGPFICAVLASVFLVTACGGDDEGFLRPLEGVSGLVAGDEPQAVHSGRAVLNQGGSAADAAVAMYFTMAVTLPSRVGLGGGGACVIFEEESRQAESLTFLPRSGTGGGVLPSGARAMQALHARFGRLHWSELVGGAERQARFGFAMSRALQADLVAASGREALSPALESLFIQGTGRLVQVGDRLRWDALADTLGGVRKSGAAYLHEGAFAERYVAGARAAGLPVSAAELAAAHPELSSALEVELDDDRAFFPRPPAAGGLTLAQMLYMAEDPGDYEDEDPAERRHLLAETAALGFALRRDWLRADGRSSSDPAELLDEDRLEDVFDASFDRKRHRTAPAGLEPGSVEAQAAGFVAIDAIGNAVACSFTLNRAFGSGRLAGDTGVILAAPPRWEGDGSNDLLATIVRGDRGGLRMAAVGHSGAPGITATLSVMLDLLAGDYGLPESLAKPRLHHGGAPDLLFHEAGIAPHILDSLRAQGHQLETVGGLGRVHAFFCPEGFDGEPQSCGAAADPRSHGVGLVVRSLLEEEEEEL
jgi:gamma-glutamyltranspeptidase/glutathione hydrolase